jgi:hypothetical protein
MSAYLSMKYQQQRGKSFLQTWKVNLKRISHDLP